MSACYQELGGRNRCPESPGSPAWPPEHWAGPLTCRSPCPAVRQCCGLGEQGGLGRAQRREPHGAAEALAAVGASTADPAPAPAGLPSQPHVFGRPLIWPLMTNPADGSSLAPLHALGGLSSRLPHGWPQAGCFQALRPLRGQEHVLGGTLGPGSPGTSQVRCWEQGAAGRREPRRSSLRAGSKLREARGRPQL